jgi:ATP-dependent helicase HrpA
MSAGPGDILVFLPTERDIRETAKMLRGWAVATGRNQDLEFLPLYARLTQAEQDRIFAAHKRRRIVLATNVAESSLTVPDVHYVIDTGTARISRYSPKAKVQRLPIEAISRASAEQRRGRCGRVAPGICLRLYSEDDYTLRDEYTTPEIRRVNLAAVVLQTLALDLGNIDQFPFLDPPRPDAVRHGYRTLFELGAIDESQALTDIGRALARMPVDPRIGRMVLAGQQEGCLHDVLIIAAALEIQDPRDRPADRQSDADAAHGQWADERSDFMGYLKLWDFYHHLRENLSRNQMRKACQQSFLSFNRLREWSETYRQLRRVVEQSGQTIPPRRDDYAAIHRSLLTGLLSGLAYRREVYEYLGAGGQKWFLWPGSSVFARRPKWVMAAEVIETSRRYGRTVAEIDPAWIEPLAQHLVRLRHVAPYWSRKRGAAMVYEKVSLFGLPIVASRPVPLGKVDPETARRMFIDHGLVQADCATSLHFLDHNQRLLRSLHDEAARARRSDWLIAETAQLHFYDERLPKDVYDLQGLEQWLPQAERQDPDRLRMRREDLLPDEQRLVPREQFPDEFAVHDTRFPLQYRFEPGHTGDGITVTVPCQLVRQLTAEQFEWLVPGRLEEKIAALIRTLPKTIRRCLVPAPDTARHVAATLDFGSGPFLKTLARHLERRAGMPVPVEAFRLEQLPDHLRMNFRVVDEQGQTVATGRSIEELARRLAGAGAALSPAIDAGPWQRDGLVSFDLDQLPESIELRIGSIPIHKYPAFVDRGTSVDLRLFDSPAEANRRLPAGLRRLFVLAETGELRAQLVWLPRLEQIRLLAAGWSGHARLEASILELLAERAFLADPPLPRSRDAFQQRLQSGGERMGLAVQEVTALLFPLFQAYHEARLAWEQSASALWQYARDDVERQMAALLPADFLVAVPWNWLVHFPRYLRAIRYRFERLRSGALPRDQKGMEQLQPLLSAYEQASRDNAELGIEDDQLTLYRWMLEELRVSLFAQPLGTSLPASVQRLQKQWENVRRP